MPSFLVPRPQLQTTSIFLLVTSISQKKYIALAINREPPCFAHAHVLIYLELRWNYEISRSAVLTAAWMCLVLQHLLSWPECCEHLEVLLTHILAKLKKRRKNCPVRGPRKTVWHLPWFPVLLTAAMMCLVLQHFAHITLLLAQYSPLFLFFFLVSNAIEYKRSARKS